MMDPREMARRLGSGLLSVPVTHFDASLAFAEDEFRQHCSWLLQRDVAGLFAAGGTGGVFREEGVFVVELFELAGRAGHGRGRREPFGQGAGFRKVVHVTLRKGRQLVVECGAGDVSHNFGSLKVSVAGELRVTRA